MGAEFARNMETVASQHYNYDQQAIEKPKPEEKEMTGSSNYYSYRNKDIELYEDIEVHCSGCEVLNLIRCLLHLWLWMSMVIWETALLFGSHIKPTSGSKVLCYGKGLFNTTKSQTFEESANRWDDVREDNLNDYQEMSITLEAEIRNKKNA